MNYRIGIALLGKGATNHLHRREVVDALNDRGIQVTFLVREDYMPLLERLDGCEYRRCSFEQEVGRLEYFRGLFRYLRGLYPARDPGIRQFHQVKNHARQRLRSRIGGTVLFFLARYRTIMRAAVTLEARLYNKVVVEGVDPTTVNQLLILGLGVTGTQMEGTLTWWARSHLLPVVHIVGNYDNLSSQGFRGVPVNRILVWGESMKNDAVNLQAIPEDRVKMIGVIRYDAIAGEIKEDRETFLISKGLDPGKKTILFAGSMMAYHYYEALATLKELLDSGIDCQMVLRIYPNKGLMNSVYMEPLLAYAAQMPNVHVSLADPHYQSGSRNHEVLQIEETELWHTLKYSDAVINLFSTIALEACVFDKPVIHMWYFAPKGRLAVAPAIYGTYPSLIHNRRLLSYGAINVATNRKQLLKEIYSELGHPERFQTERAQTVSKECGNLDGHVCDRLAEACAGAYADSVAERA